MGDEGAVGKKTLKEEKAGQFAIGARMKAQRLKRGWELDDVAAWLRIRESYLVAFEEGNVSQLPSGVYVTGFLRSYARALGLDADDIVHEFKAAVPAVKDRASKLSIPQPTGGRGLPLGVWAGMGLVVVVLAYIGFYRYVLGEGQTSQPTVVAVHQTSGAGVTGLSPEIAAVMPDTPPKMQPDTVETRVQEASAARQASGQGSAPTSADTLNTRSTSPVAPQNADMVPEPPTASPTATANPSGPAKFELVASRASWVKVIDAQGREVCNRVLRSGDVCAADERSAPYRISTGDAGGVALRFDGAVTAPLGRDAQRIRGLSLTRDDIREGRSPDISDDVAERRSKEDTTPQPSAVAAHRPDAIAGSTNPSPENVAKPKHDEGAEAKQVKTATEQSAAPVKRASMKQETTESDRLNDMQLGEIKSASARP